jgi:hypothetical protein
MWKDELPMLDKQKNKIMLLELQLLGFLPGIVGVAYPVVEYEKRPRLECAHQSGRKMPFAGTAAFGGSAHVLQAL